jgi:hypothetical protein
MKKNNNQTFTLKVHLNNPSKDKLFKTTHNFKRVKSETEAMEIIDNLWGSNSNYNSLHDKTVYFDVKSAYYGSKRII